MSSVQVSLNEAAQTRIALVATNQPLLAVPSTTQPALAVIVPGIQGPGDGSGTDLSYTASSRLLASSTGADVTLPEATTTLAGLMSGADKTKLDGVAAGAEVNVNADWNASSGDAQILNKPGLVTSSNLGLLPAPPTGAPTGKVFTDRLQWEQVSGGGLSAATLNHTTASLAAGATADFAIAGGNAFQLLAVTASTPAWVRVYGTTAARAADARTEPGGTPPGAGNDFYAELATVAALQTIRFSPVPLVQGTSGDAFIRVKNMDAVSRAITLNFSVLTLEA